MRRPILPSRPAPALVLELTRRPLQLAKGRLCLLWPVPVLRPVRQHRTRHPAAGPTVQLGAIAPAAAAAWSGLTLRILEFEASANSRTTTRSYTSAPDANLGGLVPMLAIRTSRENADTQQREDDVPLVPVLLDIHETRAFGPMLSQQQDSQELTAT